jgi:uncharacterized protein (TIGR02117 family)
MRYFKKPLKIIIIALNLLIIALALYLFSSIVFTIIPVNTNFKEAENGVEIFISSNGVHTDVIVPVKNSEKDWTMKIHPEDFKPSLLPFQYLSFGWGDRRFYLNTPTWADLKASTALNALFMGGATVMHVSYLNRRPVLDKYTRSVHLSGKQYQDLIKYIEGSFKTDAAGNYLLVKGYHYTNSNDNFYEARGSYYFFRTCNTWTNSALKHAGVKTALWAPFDESVFFHLERKDKL